MTARKNLPIGVFDSGMGGLTVLHELVNHLPNESFIYLGDTARLPYGTKSQATVKQYATQMTSLLIQLNIKLLVVACNTATTTALPHLKQQFPHIPIIGVVEPGAVAAVAATRNRNIALLATETTIKSGIYQNILHHLEPTIEVTTQSCGLFVALAEEGCIDDEIAIAVTKKYLNPILNQANPCDCIILGCTHFPVLIKPITTLAGQHITVINSAKATAKVVQTTLEKMQLQNNSASNHISFLVTDSPERFIRIGELFFGYVIHPYAVQLVDGYAQNTISHGTEP